MVPLGSLVLHYKPIKVGLTGSISFEDEDDEPLPELLWSRSPRTPSITLEVSKKRNKPNGHIHQTF